VIQNEREYQVTIEWITKFEDAIRSLEADDGSMDAGIREFVIGSMEAWLEELKWERDEYERQR